MTKGIGCQKCNWTGYMQGLANKLPVGCLECSVQKSRHNVNSNICQVCGGALVDDNVSRLCLCDIVKEKNKSIDMVNSPKHYTFGTIEVITVIDDWQLGFYEGQVIKYVGRAKHKGNELQDLKKAQWYLNRLIEQKEK